MFRPSVGSWGYCRHQKTKLRIQLCHENTSAGSPTDYGSEHCLLHHQYFLAYQFSHTSSQKALSSFFLCFSLSFLIDTLLLVVVQQKCCMQLFDSVKLEDFFYFYILYICVVSCIVNSFQYVHCFIFVTNITEEHFRGGFSRIFFLFINSSLVS